VATQHQRFDRQQQCLDAKKHGVNQPTVSMACRPIAFSVPVSFDAMTSWLLV
jgi:hypothetical protein